jgi:two-component system invasion response regulator UvrY
MKILLVEDHPIFRFGVRHLIEQRWPDAVCVEAGTLADAVAAAQSASINLAVVDLNLPDADGVEVVPKLLRVAPDMRILVLSLNAEAAYAQHLMQMGAAGYLTKDRASDELVAAIERISSGGRYITASMAEHLFDVVGGRRTLNPAEELSAQEYRVMLHLAAGKRINDIAESMNLSPKTVSTYRARVLEKIGVSSNADLAAYCIKHGLKRL